MYILFFGLLMDGFFSSLLLLSAPADVCDPGAHPGVVSLLLYLLFIGFFDATHVPPPPPFPVLFMSKGFVVLFRGK